MNPTEILRQAVEAVEEARRTRRRQSLTGCGLHESPRSPGDSWRISLQVRVTMTAAGALPVRTATEEGSSLDRIALNKLQTPLPEKMSRASSSSKKISLKSS